MGVEMVSDDIRLRDTGRAFNLAAAGYDGRTRAKGYCHGNV